MWVIYLFIAIVLYYCVRLVIWLISYYDFLFSLKAKNKSKFQDELCRMYPLLGDIEMDRYTIDFVTDKFHAPQVGEGVVVCGIEYRCIDSIDISDLDDHLKGNPIHKVCLFREDL